jgi:putative SOS response-associated peptidase YedK
MGPVMRAAGNVIELVQMNFSFPPSGRGGPVFNFKSEGRRFDKSNRCLIPASAFSSSPARNTPRQNIASRFTARRSSRLPESGGKDKGAGPPASTMLTTSPGPDVEPYHPRQIVVLRPEDWAAWIYLTRPETSCCARCQKARWMWRPCGRGAIRN